jgi:enamidase
MIGEPAKALREDSIGVIAPGKAADLLVIEGNPAENIEDIKHIKSVFRGWQNCYGK